MARLDRLIQVMHEQRAEALQLAVGRPASLVTNGTSRVLTKEPLTDPQIVSLLREIAGPQEVLQLGGAEPFGFVYQSPSGEVRVEVAPGAGGAGAMVRSTRVAAAAAAVGPSAADTAAARADIEELLRLLVEAGASDLHLRTGQPPLLRRDGELAPEPRPPLSGDRLEAMLHSIMLTRDATEFRESNDVDWAHEIEGVARFRCNAGRDRFGPMGVFRVIPTTVRSADDMGLSREVQNLCYLTKGLVVVTGPTGSGKSTTLAAPGRSDQPQPQRSHHHHRRPDRIRAPEQQVPGDPAPGGAAHPSFKHALRAALREDPDIILVGEMRDLETVSIAIETAETGHLVFGTLHTTTAASTIDRIIDQFPADRQAQVRVMLSESLRGVIAQTLCKKIGGGRVAAREILLSIPAVSNLIREGKTFQIPSVMQTTQGRDGHAQRRALGAGGRKQVEPKEAYMKAVEKQGFAQTLKARKFDTSFLGE